MAQQTAVQMLIEHIKQHGFDLEYEMEMSFLDHEKEQIIKAYKEARQIGCKCYDDLDDKNAEPYYNETYKKI